MWTSGGSELGHSLIVVGRGQVLESVVGGSGGLPEVALPIVAGRSR